MNYNIFLIYDIRKHIFSFLRKEPILKCSICNCVLIWDKSDTTKCIQIYTSNKIKNIHININI